MKALHCTNNRRCRSNQFLESSAEASNPLQEGGQPMKAGLFPPFLFTLAASASIPPPIKVGIVGMAGNHQLTWTTRLNYNYPVEASPDLENWVDTGIAEPGTGSSITYGLMSTADRMFYRIKESDDPYDGGFLALPTPSIRDSIRQFSSRRTA